jgi:hypothetical protein
LNIRQVLPSIARIRKRGSKKKKVKSRENIRWLRHYNIPLSRLNHRQPPPSGDKTKEGKEVGGRGEVEGDTPEEKKKKGMSSETHDGSYVAQGKSNLGALEQSLDLMCQLFQQLFALLQQDIQNNSIIHPTYYLLEKL